jgi:type II secretion system protein F
MPIFTYKAKDRQGGPISGSLEAESRAAVATRLQSMGLFPVDIAGDESESKGSFSSLRQRKVRIRTIDLTNFYMQMSDLIGAGVPLVKALSVVKNQTPNPSFAAILTQVNNDVQEGSTFAKALERHSDQFSNLAVALVRAGEAGGLLDETLRRVSDYAESEDELRSKIKSALAYPIIMIVLGISAIGVLMGYVMPKVMIVFDELNQTLPAMTVFVQQLSYFIADYWLALLVGLALAFLAGRRYIRTDRGAHQFHHFLLRVPVIGELILKREVAAFTRTLGALLGNGVPILNAIEISSEVLGLLPIRDDVKKIPESITQGKGMAPSLRESSIFPAVVVNMVAVGEETGQLPDVLLRVARSYETQVERQVKTLTSIIEPLIIVVLGFVVGFVVLALLLPIFSLDPSQGM